MPDFHGYPTGVLQNTHLRLEYLTHAGPRIVRLFPAGSEDNLLGEFPDIGWDSPRGYFDLIGGHRLWAAPEEPGMSYLPDSTGLAVQETIRREGLLANVRTMGERLDERLRQRFGNHHHVGDVRGRGLFRAIELVADRATKAPFDPNLKLNARIKAEAMTRGLMVYPMGGTIDGIRGDHVLLAPPFIVSEDELDEIVLRLRRALGRTLEIALAGPGH